MASTGEHAGVFLLLYNGKKGKSGVEMKKKREESKVINFMPKSISENQKKMDMEKNLINRTKEDREFIERFRNLWNL